MALDLLVSHYNPDVLSCLANLSNDEVFTPPSVVNQMLDMLPQDLFSNPDTKFLDPGCKSGVFLREIAKRLMKGLEWQFPDVEERANHIFKKQLYGIAITELTSLLSRRSLYCSKYPNSNFSVAKFDSPEGNIRFRRIKHTWNNGQCIYCGASQAEYDRGDDLETHAYEFIHEYNNEGFANMNFDVIISNPPYQLETDGAGKQAKPIYQLFVNQALKLNPRFLTMIIPSRWFAGGMGLDAFREQMKNDRHINTIVDYTNAKECFPSNSVSGGACYFLWDRSYSGTCKFTNIINGEATTENRDLNEFPVLVRYNRAIDILHKVSSKNEDSLASISSGLMPFGLSTNYRGKKLKSGSNNFALYSSKDITYVNQNEFSKGKEYIGKFKVLVSKTSAEHAGEPGKDGRFRVIPSSMKVIGPNDICTHSYFVIGQFNDETMAENLMTYLSTKFVRFLMLLAMSGYGLSKQVLLFVPIQDFSKPWSDDELYRKYGIDDHEISFIDSMIRPMGSGGEEL